MAHKVKLDGKGDPELSQVISPDYEKTRARSAMARKHNIKLDDGKGVKGDPELSQVISPDYEKTRARSATARKHSIKLDDKGVKGDSELSQVISPDAEKTRAPSARARKQSIRLDGYQNVDLPKSLLIEKTDPKQVALKKPEAELKSDVTDSKVCLVYDSKMMNHKPDYFCLKNDSRMMKHKASYSATDKPERLSSIMRILENHKVTRRVKVVKPTVCESEDLLAIHCGDHLEFIKNLPLSKNNMDKYKDHYTEDMYCSIGTQNAVYLASGAAVKACELVAIGEYHSAFAVVRPPGHHARRSIAEGFCYANNIAIAASKLIRKHGFKKVLVVDFDVHHGNGTEELFYNTNQVLFVSTYNVEISYPSTDLKDVNKIGEKQGTGYNVNIPLPNGFGDADLLYVWDEVLLPMANRYDPEIILISAGFDAAKGDSMGNCAVTPKCYATLVEKLMKVGTGRVVMSLEGGYNLSVLGDCVSHCVRALLGDQDVLMDESKCVSPSSRTKKTIKSLKSCLQKHWDVFKQPKDPS